MNPAGELSTFMTVRGIEELSGLVQDGVVYQTYESFKPKCLQRLHSVVKIADNNYKDENRLAVLREECIDTKYFLDAGMTFEEKETQCDLFAEHINTAREEELD